MRLKHTLVLAPGYNTGSRIHAVFIKIWGYEGNVMYKIRTNQQGFDDFLNVWLQYEEVMLSTRKKVDDDYVLCFICNKTIEIERYES